MPVDIVDLSTRDKWQWPLVELIKLLTLNIARSTYSKWVIETKRDIARQYNLKIKTIWLAWRVDWIISVIEMVISSPF